MKITTKEQLINHINEHKGKNVPLFSAGRKFLHIKDDTLKGHHKITIEPSKYEGLNDFIYLDGEATHSLKDRHLDGDNTYNDNYWFTTREEAEDYIK